ncbi:sulfatase-like hydrolase/transferase [Salinirubellus sp. GCM10025818]|uniref:sulfatase-like hydrolase/transferase n=1 Tax=Salinirubellus TaxID=2162630 RepID=UPI0030D05188
MSDDGRTRGVLLVTVDSLRADALDVMPRVRGLADRGVRFDRAFAHGNWTPFSFPSILGADPVFADAPRVGPSRRPTLAESLDRDGVDTAGINAANGFLTAHWGYDRGFGTYETFMNPSGPVGRFLAAHPTVGGWAQVLGSPLRRAANAVRGIERHHAVDTSHLLRAEERALEFLDRETGGLDREGQALDRDGAPDRGEAVGEAERAGNRADDPFFLWVHYMDTHTPYVPAPKHVRAVTDGEKGAARMFGAHLRAGLGRGVSDRTLDALRDLYLGAAHQVDASVGRLLDALEARGLREETAVLVAGDHGEEFMEHGHLAHYPKLYDELIHVPLVADVPEGASLRVPEAVGLDLIPPTVADLLGVPGDFDGRSALPVLRGEEPPADEPVVSVAVRGESVTQQPIPRRLDDGDLLVSARTDRWTYVLHTATGERELYDREVDPGEEENVLEVHEGEGIAPVERLDAAVGERVERIEAMERRSGSEGDDRRPETPSDIDRQLKALGYR